MPNEEDEVRTNRAKLFIRLMMRDPWISEEIKVRLLFKVELKERRKGTNPVLLSEEGRVSERVEFLLSLTHESVETSLHIGKLLSDMVHEHLLPQRPKRNDLKVSPRSRAFRPIPTQTTRRECRRTWLSVLAKYLVPHL